MSDQRPRTRRAMHLPPGGRTAASDLRERLERCEKWVIVLDQPEVDPIDLLRQLDAIADQFEALEARGADLQAERGRFENLLNQLRRRDAKLVARLGDSLAAERPDDGRWWWYLDRAVSERRIGYVKRAIAISLGLVILLAAAYFLYERFLAPPPNVREAYGRMLKGEAAAAEGKLDEAIVHFEAAASADPQEEEAYLWLGVLYQIQGQPQASRAAFEQARVLIKARGEADDQVQFYVWRGTVYARLGDVEAATDDALQAISLDPESAEAHFLLGQAAELAGDAETAAQAYMRAIELAEASGDIELEAIVRVRLAAVLQAGP